MSLPAFTSADSIKGQYSLVIDPLGGRFIDHNILSPWFPHVFALALQAFSTLLRTNSWPFIIIFYLMSITLPLVKYLHKHFSSIRCGINLPSLLPIIPLQPIPSSGSKIKDHFPPPASRSSCSARPIDLWSLPVPRHFHCPADSARRPAYWLKREFSEYVSDSLNFTHSLSLLWLLRIIESRLTDWLQKVVLEEKHESLTTSLAHDRQLHACWNTEVLGFSFSWGIYWSYIRRIKPGCPTRCQ